MLFNSLKFLVFFPAVVLLYFVLPKRVRNLWLLVASYVFYMGWNAKYVVLLFTSTLITYLSGLLLERVKDSDQPEAKKTALKKWVVAVSFLLNLGILFYFKYVHFFLDTLGTAASLVGLTLNVPKFDILLPVGISFFTFQALSYTVDVYRGEIGAEKSFLRYALFVSFFPQLVAGPIERSKNLLQQLDTPKSFDFDRAREGFVLILWGYFLKIVLADRIAIFVDTVLVIGVNGVGKTTTIGKIAKQLCDEGKKVLLVAGDTFRAAAADQLEIWAERSGADIVRQHEGADPASVVYDGIQSAKTKGVDVIIIDTAGRLHNKTNLMNELNKISRIVERELPNASREVLLVLDGTTGQNGLIQAKQFKEIAGVTALAVTKLDGTAKGGIVIAVADTLGLPVKFIGVGEKAEDLMPFQAKDFVDALFE